VVCGFRSKVVVVGKGFPIMVSLVVEERVGRMVEDIEQPGVL
jgi:hypothetical protein